jgi:hypothetical protein
MMDGKNRFCDLFRWVGMRVIRRSDELFVHNGRLRGSAAHLPYLISVTTRREATENERVRHTRRSREAQLGVFGLQGRFG